MIGIITTRDILANPIITIRCFGWRVFLKAIVFGHHQTFLSLLQPSAPPRKANPRLAALIDRCIGLELRSKRLYEQFSENFGDNTTIGRFLNALAIQEQSHADLLAFCRDTAIPDNLPPVMVLRWEESVTALEGRMTEVESIAADMHTEDETLRVVILLESSEINRLFRGVVTSCANDFTNALTVFRQALDWHISFIVEQIPGMSSNFAQDLKKLRIDFLPK
jgi:hypothetical protein